MNVHDVRLPRKRPIDGVLGWLPARTHNNLDVFVGQGPLERAATGVSEQGGFNIMASVGNGEIPGNPLRAAGSQILYDGEDSQGQRPEGVTFKSAGGEGSAQVPWREMNSTVAFHQSAAGSQRGTPSALDVAMPPQMIAPSALFFTSSNSFVQREAGM
jgi:hypothetical protein